MIPDRGPWRDPAFPAVRDREELADWISGYREPLLARIRRMMGPEAREGEESNDVLQSVVSEALRHLKDDVVRDEKHLLRWMTAAARHQIIDEVRRRREQSLELTGGEPIASGESSVAAQLSAQEARQRLREALDTLDPDRRSVVELRSLDGWPWRRISEVLERSEEAVRKLYHRSLVELGQRLGGDGSESAPRPVVCETLPLVHGSRRAAPR